jgi:hypothetical protein
MATYVSPFAGDVVQPTDVSYISYTLTASISLIWPINGSSPNDKVAARIIDVSLSNSAFTLSMPPADQTSVGTDALIRNVGSATLTVLDYSGGTITTVPVGVAVYIFVSNSSTPAGTWGIFTFGAGTSAASAGALAGYGLLATAATLSQSHPSATIGASYTAAITDRAQTLVWTGGATTVTLSTATTYGNNWFTLLKNNGTGTLTVNTSSSELLDGSTSKTFAPGNSAFIICTGSGFVTIGYGQSSTFAYTALTFPVTGGSYTLTATQAANTIQTYTGTLSSNVNIVFPPVVNLYVISNQTTAGAYTFSIGTGSGASVTIPANNQVTVICDGTNFFNANTSTVSGSLASLLDGTVANPALYFASETGTGVFRPGAGQFGVAVLGSLIFNVTATGISVTGTGTFSGGISGGTFS